MERRNEEKRKKEKAFQSVIPNTQSVGLTQTAMTCPNCGGALEGRKCKLLCTKPGCGYMVTCSEW